MPESSTFRVPIIVWSILLLGLGYAGYWRFDHTFISPGLKESLTAAVDPANTESDILTDLRNAQSQIHTTRDAEVESMLQRAVLLMQSAEVASQTASANSAELDKYIALQRQYKRQNMKVPQSLKDYIQRATQEEQQAKKNPSAAEVLDQQVAQENSAQAAHLFQQLRAALGLPPLPKK